MVAKAQEASSSAAPSETPAPTNTPQPSATPVPSASPVPSATPEPTSTPQPSNTPQPTSTPESTPSATPSATPSPSTTPTTPEPSSSPIPTSVTTPTVSLTNPYSYNNMEVKFSKLPEQAGTVTFTTKTLTQSQTEQLKALSSTVYEISSSMNNGTFTYDLTLPLPPGINGNNFKVLYAQDVNSLDNAAQVNQSITVNDNNTFTIHNLDHFTVFVVVNPNTQANCDAVTLGTVSGTTCFSTIQAAVDASSNGDTVTIGAGTYNETVNVTKQLNFTGQGNPVVNAFVLQTTPVTFTGITAGSITIATPTVSLTNPVYSGNQNNVTITGTGAPNATVNYTIGSVSGTGVVASDGTINISGINVSSLPDGNLTLSVTLSSGDYSSSAGTNTANKDTQAPSLATNLSITNPIHNSNKATIAISGNGEAGASANWTISDGAFSVSGTATVSGGGTFSVNTINVSSLSDGTLTLSVTLTDTAGNTNSAATTTSTKNTQPPTLTSVAISSSNANASLTKIGDIANLTFTSSETIQTPVVTLAGHLVSPTNTGGNNWLASYALTSSDTEGLVSFVIDFTDFVGNAGDSVTSTTNSSSVTFDKTDPSFSGITISSSNANPNLAKVGDTITVDFTSSETIQTPVVGIAFQFATVINLGGNNWRATYTMTSSDTEGTMQYTINVTDLAGNTPITVPGLTGITFDKSAPTITSQALTSSNSNPNYAKTGDTVTLTFTSSESIQTPVVTIAGHSVSATNTSGNDWTATYNMASSDTEGLISYTIDYIDLSGNTGTTVNTNSTIIFDLTNPTLTSTNVTSSNTNPSYAKAGDTITLTFTSSEAIQTPSVTIAGHSVIATNTSGNTWTATYIMATADTEGLIAYTITFTDTAGNAGAAVNTNSAISFDKTIPTLLTITTTTTNANSSYAKIGDTITVAFIESEPIQTPSVTIAGHNVTVSNQLGITWVAEYTLTAQDTEGPIAYTIAYQDAAGNAGTIVNTNSTITFDKTAPSASFTTPSANTNVSGIVTITTNTADANGISSVTFSYKRNDGVDTFHDITGTSWDTNALALDNYTLRLTVTDNAGNTTVVDQTVGVATVISSQTIQTNTAASDSITITWTTDDPTSSRVVYDVFPHPILGFSPNYGYTNSSTIQDISSKVTNHSVVLSGLRPGTKYYYRVISAGSPEAVSEQFSFTTTQAPAALGGIGSTSASSAPFAPVCVDAPPGSAPVLLSVTVSGRRKVKLVWGKAKDPVTYYLIEYGLGHDSYQFGVPNVGNVTEYEIGELDPGATYYFRVRAGNYCAGGEFSNELAVRNSTTSTTLLGVTPVFADGISLYSSNLYSQAFTEAIKGAEISLNGESTQSALQATASAQPLYSVYPSPTAVLNQSKSGINYKNILVTSGIVLLIAGLYTYSRSLKKKA